MNKDLILAVLVSCFVCFVFNNAYSTGIRTEFDFIVFNMGLLFLFCLLPVYVIVKQKKKRRLND